MSRPVGFGPGAHVLWGGEEYIIWSLHPKPAFRWITRNGKVVEAKVKNLTPVESETPVPSPSRAAARLVKSAHPSPRKITDRDRFIITAAFEADAASHGGVVNPNRVRAALSDENGLRVPARALSTMYSALAQQGLLRSLGFTDVNTDTRGGNAGKPAREWQWTGALPAEATG